MMPPGARTKQEAIVRNVALAMAIVLAGLNGAPATADPVRAQGPEAPDLWAPDEAAANGVIGAWVTDIAPYGMLVTAVRKGGPAHRSGLSAGDVIVGVVGVRIDGHADLDAAELITGPIGTTVSLGVRRGSEALSFDIPRAEASDEEDWLGMEVQGPARDLDLNGYQAAAVAALETWRAREVSRLHDFTEQRILEQLGPEQKKRWEEGREERAGELDDFFKRFGTDGPD